MLETNLTHEIDTLSLIKLFGGIVITAALLIVINKAAK